MAGNPTGVHVAARNVRLKYVPHWSDPVQVEYRTVDAENEPVYDGILVAIDQEELLDMTVEEVVDAARADAVARDFLHSDYATP